MAQLRSQEEKQGGTQATREGTEFQAEGAAHCSTLQKEGTRGCRDRRGQSRGNGVGPVSWVCDLRGT